MRISVRLSDKAWRGLDRYATTEHATMTAVIEALGRLLDDGWTPPKRLIDEAHRIDRERRSR